jgi:alpha-D-xyloside xylohydrolase
MRIRTLAATGVAVLVAGHALAGTFEKTATGVVVKPDSGAAKEVRLRSWPITSSTW